MKVKALRTEKSFWSAYPPRQPPMVSWTWPGATAAGAPELSLSWKSYVVAVCPGGPRGPPARNAWPPAILARSAAVKNPGVA